jgi:hypothetical protein
MVRPERRVLLAGVRPVRVGARAPGSRPLAEGEILAVKAGRQEPLKEKGATKRAVTHRERCSLVRLSAERCLGGPSRSCHGEGNRQQGRLEPLLDLSGVWAMARFERRAAEQERPYLAAWSGKDRAYKAGRRKARGAGRESERSIVPGKACITTRWREGALL